MISSMIIEHSIYYAPTQSMILHNCDGHMGSWACMPTVVFSWNMSLLTTKSLGEVWALWLRRFLDEELACIVTGVFR